MTKEITFNFKMATTYEKNTRISLPFYDALLFMSCHNKTQSSMRPPAFWFCAYWQKPDLQESPLILHCPDGSVDVSSLIP